ncbi:MAG: hypothetical protein ACRDY5_06465, partial [Acidimicrobiales bacterium]
GLLSATTGAGANWTSCTGWVGSCWLTPGDDRLTASAPGGHCLGGHRAARLAPALALRCTAVVASIVGPETCAALP